MGEKVFQFAMIVSIPAESYEKAKEEAHELAEDMGVDAGMGIELVTSYEHDNDGQRVLYLHPEDNPDWEPEDD